MTRLLAILMLALFMLAGCSAKPITGEVKSKRFVPAHTWVEMVPITTSDGKNTTTTFVPVTRYEPDRWHISVEPRDADGNPLPVKDRRVTKAAYDQITVGAWYSEEPDKIDKARDRQTVGESEQKPRAE